MAEKSKNMEVVRATAGSLREMGWLTDEQHAEVVGPTSPNLRDAECCANCGHSVGEEPGPVYCLDTDELVDRAHRCNDFTPEAAQ